jgi:hypothetical protein
MLNRAEQLAHLREIEEALRAALKLEHDLVAAAKLFALLRDARSHIRELELAA